MAVLEGLEVDQYLWGIVQGLENSPDADEIVVDQAANWRPANMKAIVKTEGHGKSANYCL